MSITGYRWMMNGVNEPLTRQEFTAVPEAGEVVVEVAGCGVCHTDLGFFYDGVRTNSALPLTLGHEISGRVVAAGAGADSWLNKAVIIPAVMPCGECDLCKRGKGTICRSQKMPGNDIQGGFASHIVGPARDLCPVDEQRLSAAGLELADVALKNLQAAIETSPLCIRSNRFTESRFLLDTGDDLEPTRLLKPDIETCI